MAKSDDSTMVRTIVRRRDLLLTCLAAIAWAPLCAANCIRSRPSIRSVGRAWLPVPLYLPEPFLQCLLVLRILLLRQQGIRAALVDAGFMQGHVDLFGTTGGESN